MPDIAPDLGHGRTRRTPGQRHEDDPYAQERDETPIARLDRNWSELLQELRVTQTGIQILSGFLLILPFQPLFPREVPELVAVYLLALLFGTLATGLMVAPVTAHRLLFRHRVKDRLVTFGDRAAKTGLFSLAMTMGLVVTLVVGTVVSLPAGRVAGFLALVALMVLWMAVPIAIRRRYGRDRLDS